MRCLLHAVKAKGSGAVQAPLNLPALHMVKGEERRGVFRRGVCFFHVSLCCGFIWRGSQRQPANTLGIAEQFGEGVRNREHGYFSSSVVCPVVSFSLLHVWLYPGQSLEVLLLCSRSPPEKGIRALVLQIM